MQTCSGLWYREHWLRVESLDQLGFTYKGLDSKDTACISQLLVLALLVLVLALLSHALLVLVLHVLVRTLLVLVLALLVSAKHNTLKGELSPQIFLVQPSLTVSKRASLAVSGTDFPIVYLQS